MARLFIILLLVSCSEKQCKTVESVGGCTSDGCGGKFSDSTYGTAHYPVVGRYMCKDKSNYYPAEQD